MQNKKIVYILIPVVAVIWGIIIIRIHHLVDNHDSPRIQTHTRFEPVITTNPLDTYNIKSRNFDPFLQVNKIEEVLIEEETHGYNFEKPETSFNQYVHTVSWPEIIYSGSIENSGVNNRVGLIKVGGQQILIREDQNILGMQVVKIYGDSIVLKLSGTRKTFNKQMI